MDAWGCCIGNLLEPENESLHSAVWTMGFQNILKCYNYDIMPLLPLLTIETKTETSNVGKKKRLLVLLLVLLSIVINK